MKITRAQLMTVIRQRVEELTNEIEAALKDLGFTGPVGRQVVLTGGGAELKNIADYCRACSGGPSASDGRSRSPGFRTRTAAPPLRRSSASLSWRARAAATLRHWLGGAPDAGQGVIGKLFQAMKGGV